MEKEVNVNGKIFIVREVLAKELDDADIDWSNPKEARKKQLILGANLTSEQYDNLTMKERLKIQQAFNELNIDDFHVPTQIITEK